MVKRRSSGSILFPTLYFIISLCCGSFKSYGQNIPISNVPYSTASEAMRIVDSAKNLSQSIYWKNVAPAAFLENIKSDIREPLGLYEGNYTNFCGYAALTYLPLHDDPASFVRFMLQLYKNGEAIYGKAHFRPSATIQTVAGTLRFKGKLDIRPADQLWFLSLADHFKGYLNIFSKKFKAGAEDTFWASVNYGKFNRMIKALFHYEVSARGSDLMHPFIKNLKDYLTGELKSGTTFLYLNSEFLLKKNENLKPGIPTHYIVLLDLTEEKNGMLTMTYWDYGYKSLRQFRPAFLKKIVFGVTHCTLKPKGVS